MTIVFTHIFETLIFMVYVQTCTINNYLFIHRLSTDAMLKKA